MSARYPYSDPAYRVNRALALERDRWRCQIRGPKCTGVATTANHRIALAKGGTHNLDNLEAACAACNYGDGARMLNKLRATALGRRSRHW